MSTITAILEADADGTLHLPVPAEWRHQPIRVKVEMELAVPLRKPDDTASLKAVNEFKKNDSSAAPPQPGSLKGFWMAPDFDEPLEDFKEYMG